jgi:UDP-N-acetylglucosamine/UDP-N-acetylgalactosamine diphosphorylase
MVELKGYEDIIEKVYSRKQEHVFQYWDKLSHEEKTVLLKELREVDFELLEKLFNSTENPVPAEFEPAPYIRKPQNDEEKKAFTDAERKGIEHIKAGKVAAFIVAGGQGSRLGYDGPKGKFPAGPVSGKSLFHFHGEKIYAASKKYSTVIPYLIMTSTDNHDETIAFFEEENYFGLNKNDVYFFKQNMIPSLDDKGDLVLSGKNRLFRNPDGHGGSITALRNSGVLDILKDRGIETLSYFQVDNPLVKIIDPAFIGFHLLHSADMSSKALIKAYPEEKIGAFVKFPDDNTGIIEYSDMPDEKLHLKNNGGNLVYAAGSPAIHIFSRSFIEEITRAGGTNLPYHTARKDIRVLKNGGYTNVKGYKFEKFVFDALPLARKDVILETAREEEFAPIKNAEGIDSAASSAELMSNLYRSWLISNGVKIPEKVKIIEISPLLSFDGSEIPSDITVPDREKVYLK